MRFHFPTLGYIFLFLCRAWEVGVSSREFSGQDASAIESSRSQTWPATSFSRLSAEMLVGQLSARKIIGAEIWPMVLPADRSLPLLWLRSHRKGKRRLSPELCRQTQTKRARDLAHRRLVWPPGQQIPTNNSSSDLSPGGSVTTAGHAARCRQRRA